MGAVHVETARTVDRDWLLERLGGLGVDARAEENGLGIEIPCDGGEEGARCHELYGTVEALIAESGLPFVPLELDGSVYVRPPLS